MLNENSNASDVTAEYTDLEAQLRNLEAAERELQALLTEVRERPNAKPADILEVYNALSQKRGEIEQVKGRLQYLQNQVGFSTITSDLVPDEVTAPVIDEGWQPLVTVKNAFRSLVNILQGLVVLLINLVIVVLPVLLLVALPIVLLVLLVRWLVRRRKRIAAGTSAPGDGSSQAGYEMTSRFSETSKVWYPREDGDAAESLVLMRQKSRPSLSSMKVSFVLTAVQRGGWPLVGVWTPGGGGAPTHWLRSRPVLDQLVVDLQRLAERGFVAGRACAAPELHGSVPGATSPLAAPCGDCRYSRTRTCLRLRPSRPRPCQS